MYIYEKNVSQIFSSKSIYPVHIFYSPSGNLLHFFPVAFCRSAVVCVLRGRYGMTSERRNDIQNDLNDSRMQKVVLVSFIRHLTKSNVVSLSFLVIPGMTFFGRMTLKRFLAIVLVSFFFFSLILPPD